MTIDTTVSKEQALQQIAEHLAKEAAAKMVTDIGPMLANGTSGSVAGESKSLFAGVNGAAGQAGVSCAVGLGGE